MPAIRIGMALQAQRPSSGGAPAFDPATLFSVGGSIGGYGFASTTECWQDVARTTPAVIGNEVLSWRIQAAGGPIYATGSAGTGPIYREDITAIGYLDFAGGKRLATGSLVWGSDEVTAIFGATKIDTTQGTIVELSPSTTFNNGAFWLYTNTDTWNFRSKGTVASTQTVSGYTASRTDIVTGLGKVATDQNIIRVNGTQVGSLATDQGTGNFGTYALNFGQRADASLSLTGRIYSFVLINRILAGADLTNAEAWVDTKTQNPF